MKALRGIGLWGALVLGCVQQPLNAQAPANSDKPAVSLSVKPPERERYAFEMRNKPWSAVIEWLCDHAGVPFVGHVMPTGTFTFINPRVGGESRKYTIAEVIDIVNDGLLPQRYLL